MHNCPIQINTSNSQYAILSLIARQLDWETSENDDDPFDVLWIDSGMNVEILQTLLCYQKVNHFPGMFTITRKDNLGKNLNWAKQQLPKEFNFFPQTWVLPRDRYLLLKQFNKKRAKTFIVKPEASCQGRGIFLTRHIEQIQENCIVQRYLHRPYLIDDLKFDIRLYVLVASCEPLQIFLHREGLVRLATEAYTPPIPSNLGDLYKHLTNYAINKNNPNFIHNSVNTGNSQGHKRSLNFLWSFLQEKGADVNELQQKIKDIIVKTVLLAQPQLKHLYRQGQAYDVGASKCFEILGFDIFLDWKLKPWLIEVNHSPSFTATTPLDKAVKTSVIKDALMILQISQQNRLLLIQQQKQLVQQRQQMRYSELQRSNIRTTLNEQGGYEKLYPIMDDKYCFIEQVISNRNNVSQRQKVIKQKNRIAQVSKSVPQRKSSGYKMEERKQYALKTLLKPNVIDLGRDSIRNAGNKIISNSIYKRQANTVLI